MSPGGSYNGCAQAYAGRLAMFGGGMWPNLGFGQPQAAVNKTFAIVPWPVSTSPAPRSAWAGSRCSNP